MTLDELKEAQARSSKALSDAYIGLGCERRRRIAEATKLIDKKLLPMEQEVMRLDAEFRDAQRAVEDELIRLANDGSRHKYAVGTKLVRKETKHRGRSAGYGTYENTFSGVLEVVTRETQFPENTSSYFQPSVGEFIVRLCTKDGKPGKRFEKYRDSDGWMQADATPTSGTPLRRDNLDEHEEQQDAAKQHAAERTERHG